MRPETRDAARLTQRSVTHVQPVITFKLTDRLTASLPGGTASGPGGCSDVLTIMMPGRCVFSARCQLEGASALHQLEKMGRHPRVQSFVLSASYVCTSM